MSRLAVITVPARSRRAEVTVIALAVAVAALLAGHRLVPDLGGVGTLLDSVLPWLGLAVPLLAVIAWPATRTVRAVLAVLLPAIVWAAQFGPAVLPKTGTGPGEFTVVDQNIDAANQDPCAALRALAGRHAALVAVEELSGRAATCLPGTLDAAYPYRARTGTVGLWSAYPLHGTEPLELGLDWYRALRTEVSTPDGPVVVYVAHLPSIRLGATTERDNGLRALATRLAAEPPGPVLVVGDLNTASTDRALTRFAGYREAQLTAGTGFGFTWPASFPVTRPDHILYRGLGATSAGTLPANGSDHRAVTAALTLR